MAKNGSITEAQARRMIGAGARTPPPTVDEHTISSAASEGTMARGRFRPSPQYPRLWQQAVSNDDGTGVTQYTDTLVAELLEAVRSIRDKAPLIQPRQPQWAPKIWESNVVQIPGIGAAVAYASGDAFGTVGVIAGLPSEGWISMVRFWDFDDEGIAKILMLFNTEGDVGDITFTGDNSAFDPSDSELLHRGHAHLNIAASDFANFSLNQFGTSLQPDVPILAPDGRLAFIWITQGADNIAATAMPAFQLVGTHYALR